MKSTLSGHHDSAYVFRLLQAFPRSYFLFVLLANVFIWGAVLLIRACFAGDGD